MKIETRIRPHWQNAVLFVLLVIASLAAIKFGLQAYGSFLLLRSAYELGVSDVSSVRPWMTLRYVAATHHVPEAELMNRLEQPSDADPKTTLRSVALQRGISPFQYVQQVQKAISDLRRLSPVLSSEVTASEGLLEDRFLSALLTYGYPVLGLTLLLGAIGAPLPSAPSMVVAGSLAAQGHMSWLGASTVAVTGSVLGDLLGYSLGRAFSRESFKQRSSWIGLTPARQARVERLLQQWGMLGILLSRSLLSFLSSAVNLMAGAGRYPLRLFLPIGIVGRLIWTSAYLVMGFTLAVGVEAAANFLSSLSGLLVSLALSVGLGLSLFQQAVK